MPKQFDLVVHGATGFTGRLVVEYLLQRYPNGSGLRWARDRRSRWASRSLDNETSPSNHGYRKRKRGLRCTSVSTSSSTVSA